MSRVLKRPMFKMGGSTSGGITSGLKRTGYDNGGLTTEERLMRAVGPPRKNVYDFLIDFGLNIASMPPQGNIISTAAAAAKEPFGKFSEANRADENLRRQVGIEAAGIDIRAEQAKDAAAAEAQLKRDLLDKKLDHETKLHEKQLETDKENLWKNQAVEWVAEGVYNNLATAERAAKWMYLTAEDYSDKRIGGFISEEVSYNSKAQAKFANKQGKKNGVGTIYYDPYQDRTVEIAMVDGKYILQPVAGAGFDKTYTSITEDTETSNEVNLTKEEAEIEAAKRGLTLIGDRPEGAGKGWLLAQKRKDPKAVTIVDLIEIIKNEQFKERYKNIKKSRTR
tara:strand:+ start:278 stop:1288 length:1011 start_codon:yes stop_codon:yes gene_type:complete